MRELYSRLESRARRTTDINENRNEESTSVRELYPREELYSFVEFVR